MASSGDNIKGYILAEMKKNPAVFKMGHPILELFVECIAKGVYEGMKELDDKAGTPPSTGHL